jgi:hypothetical protein
MLSKLRSSFCSKVPYFFEIRLFAGRECILPVKTVVNEKEKLEKGSGGGGGGEKTRAGICPVVERSL